MSLIKKFSTGQVKEKDTLETVVEVSPDVDEPNSFDPSYEEFIRETRQGIADFVDGHYIPPTKGDSNCPDGYIS